MTVKLDPELKKQDRFANSSGSEYYYIPLRANRPEGETTFWVHKITSTYIFYIRKA